MKWYSSGWILAGSAAIFVSSIAADALAQAKVAPGRPGCDPRVETDCFPELVIKAPNGRTAEVSGTRADMERQLIEFVESTSPGPVNSRQVQQDVNDLLDSVASEGRSKGKPKIEHKISLGYELIIK